MCNVEECITVSRREVDPEEKICPYSSWQLSTSVRLITLVLHGEAKGHQRQEPHA